MKKTFFSTIAILTLITTSSFADDILVKKGDIASNELLQTLGKNLTQQIQKNGPIAAINFCSKEASSLTDKVGRNNNVSIKRVSVQNRNQNNTPNSDDLVAINEFEQDIKNTKELSHKIINNKYYKAITINKDACIVCHGDLDKDGEIYKTISKLYPNDKATGYKMGDLRGVIAVELPQ